MNLGDLKKVWEIKTLKRKPKEEEARKILDTIAKQVQPIMRKHNWRVKVLSEFCPKNRSLLGLNVGAGIHVKLRLRRPDRDEEFIPFHEVLDTMLHELCHNAISPHNASFYKLWDELRKECEDLVNKGIRVSGQGFDLPGKRLGGTSWKPLHSSLRQAALSAAENRARLGSLLPSGSKKIGGDCSIMVALSPVQAAAMAAERRLQDNIWCGSEFYDLTEEDECNDEHNVTGTSRKRSRESNDVSLPHSANAKVESTFIDLTETASENRCYSDKFSPIKNYLKENVGVSTSSISSHDPVHVDVCGSWQCTACTLVNPPLAPVCGLCEAKKPGDISQKTLIWSCKFCTCENDVKVDKCSVCDSWRYSYGPPVSASAPNLGT